MAYGKVLEIFLVDGNPTGLRTIVIKNRNITGLAISRNNLKELLEYKELFPGVYFLFGIDEESLKNTIYVGETEDFKSRIKQHVDKEFWNQVVFFTSKEFNKAHIRYLEANILKELDKAQKVILMNQNVPKEAIIAAADKAVMEEVKNDIFLILGTIGYPDINRKAKSSTKIKGKSMEDYTFYLKYKSKQAKMIPTSSGLMVLKSSDIFYVKERYFEGPRSLNHIKVIQDKLVNNGGLVKDGEIYRLKTDVNFLSPSAASAFVKGAPSNGRTDWKTKNGKTFAEIEAELLGKD